jgi:hypothetical protein
MKNLLLLPGIEFRFLGHAARRLVIVPTELSQQEDDNTEENWQAERSGVAEDDAFIPLMRHERVNYGLYSHS